MAARFTTRRTAAKTACRLVFIPLDAIPMNPHNLSGVRRLFVRLAANLAMLACSGWVAAVPLSVEDARHLMSRAGFTPTETEVRQFTGLQREEAVERMLRASFAATQTTLTGPEWVNEEVQRPARLKSMSEEERRAYQQREASRQFELKTWWMTRMLETPSPLAERMTLFWHNHFVSSAQKVKSPQLMYRQNLLLRRHALGNFGELLHAASKDPAMILYLDAASNRKGQPNENFAREVMELFTLGEGNYSERDIKEAARAFTGWSLDVEDKAAFRFRPGMHDDGVKTVLGRSGNLDGDAVLDILLAQPAAAEFVVRKLWREFVAPDVETPANRVEVTRIAGLFRQSRHDIRVALRGIFTSPRFYAPEHRAVLVKSPVELVVGTVRQLGITYTDPLPFSMVAAGLGQNLFAPPNVRGWPGGEAWINSTTLLARKQFVERMFRVDEMRDLAGGVPQMVSTAPVADMRPREFGDVKGAARMGPEGRERFQRAAASIQMDSGKYLAQFAGQPYGAIKRAVLPGEPANPLATELTPAQLLKALLLDPMYQLK